MSGLAVRRNTSLFYVAENQPGLFGDKSGTRKSLTELLRRVKGFFVPGERDAFSRIQELAGLGEEALQLLVKMLSSPSNGLRDIESYTERINILEKEGDKITESLEEMIGRGSMTASLDYDFARLADNVDSILDRAHGLSRQLRRVTRRPLRGAKEFDSDIRTEQISLVEVGLEQLRIFRKLLNVAGSDREAAIRLAREIESLEEQGDDVKDSMLDEIYGSWEKLDFASFHNYLETTIEADDILDLCEDASDLVMAITKALGA
jgi:uncharacterized protein Yka (UPF0111/DUF47 family)